MDNINEKLAEAVNGNPLPIIIKDDKTGEERHFIIKQPTFAMLIEVSRLLSSIDIHQIADVFESKNVFDFVKDHGEKILKIISIVLDRNVEYSKETYDFLEKNLLVHESYDLLSNVILKLGISSFQNTIIKIIPMSLLNQTEIIALVQSRNLTHSNS